jgi:hypothetical protein
MRDLSLPKPADGTIIAPTSPEIWGMSAQINAKARGSRGKMVRITGRITSCATLALLLVANASPGSAQGTKMSDVADQLRTALGG